VEEWRSGGVEECEGVQECRSAGVDKWISGGVGAGRSGCVAAAASSTAAPSHRPQPAAPEPVAALLVQVLVLD
jgi:hypothetical protein